MDTGSQWKFIIMELADNLQFKSSETQEFSVYTFRNKKPKKDNNITNQIKIKTNKRWHHTSDNWIGSKNSYKHSWVTK